MTCRIYAPDRQSADRHWSNRPGRRPETGFHPPLQFAAWVCRAINSSRSCLSPDKPPVSTTMKCLSPRSPTPYCRSRVSPGSLATMASRLRVNTLNRVDLPTLGAPDQRDYGDHCRNETEARRPCSSSVSTEPLQFRGCTKFRSLVGWTLPTSLPSDLRNQC